MKLSDALAGYRRATQKAALGTETAWWRSVANAYMTLVLKLREAQAWKRFMVCARFALVERKNRNMGKAASWDRLAVQALGAV